MYSELANLGTLCHCNFLCQGLYNLGHHDLPVLQCFLFCFLDHRSDYNWTIVPICSQLNIYEEVICYSKPKNQKNV